MTTVAHVVSASYLALTAAGVGPGEKWLVGMALVVPALLDLDHVYFLVRDRKYYREHGYKGNLHQARSVVHELGGLLGFGLVGVVMALVDWRMGFVVYVTLAVHLVQDMLVGRSMPLKLFDRGEINFLPQRMRLKTIIDVVVLAVFSLLWIRYLRGPA